MHGRYHVGRQSLQHHMACHGIRGIGFGRLPRGFDPFILRQKLERTWMPGTAIRLSARRVWICACCAGLATATLDVGVLRPSCRCAASFLKPMALAALGSRPSDSRYRCRGDRTMLFKLDAGSWLTRENIDLIVVPYNF